MRTRERFCSDRDTLLTGCVGRPRDEQYCNGQVCDLHTTSDNFLSHLVSFILLLCDHAKTFYILVHYNFCRVVAYR